MLTQLVCFFFAVAPLVSAEGSGGVLLEVWNNTALAYEPASSSVVESIGSQPASELLGSAQWTGVISVPETANYNFTCTFEGGYGLLWIDDHLWCNHGMPRYSQQYGPPFITLSMNRSYPIRAQLFHNETGVIDVPIMEVKWVNNKSQTQPAVIPSQYLSPTLPPADKWRLETQSELTNSWGSYYAHNLLAVTRFPDHFQLNVGLCQISSGDCEYDTVDSANSVRLGHHAFDNSYVQYYHSPFEYGSDWDGGVNVSVAWSSQPSKTDPSSGSSAAAEDLTLVMEGISAKNWSNYVFVVVPEFCVKFSGTGTVTVDGSNGQITATPVGLPATTITATGAQPYKGPAFPGLEKAAHLSFMLGGAEGSARAALPLIGVSTLPLHAWQQAPPPGESSDALTIDTKEQTIDTKEQATPAELMRAQLDLMRKKEEATYAKYGELADTAAAVQSSVMWLIVYEHYVGGGLILTISRGSMGGGDTMCDWDNFFAAYMLGLDQGGKSLAFVTFAEQMKYRTTNGFVPNCGQGAKKAMDRTEPVVGAKVLREFVNRWGKSAGSSDQHAPAADPSTVALVELLFDDLFAWHDWFWQQRRLPPLNLIAVGSSPTARGGMGVDVMQGARWESGMDNSPMYDGPDESANNTGPIKFDTQLHLMELYDVGMSSNLLSDMQALVELSPVLTNGNTPGGSPASRARVEAQVKTLRQRIKELTALIGEHFWDEESKIFVNKRPAVVPPKTVSLDGDADGDFYRRFSPTSFYPMMAGAASVEQATDMMTEHLMHPGRFCVRAPDEWPPTAEEMALPAGGVLLQTWRKDSDEVTCVAPCSAFATAGYTLSRNESVAYAHTSSTGASANPMAPVYLYKRTDKCNQQHDCRQASGDDYVIGLANFSAAAAHYSNRSYERANTNVSFYIEACAGGGLTGDLSPPSAGGEQRAPAPTCRFTFVPLLYSTSHRHPFHHIHYLRRSYTKIVPTSRSRYVATGSLVQRERRSAHRLCFA
jgi:hypothetical protein